VEIRSLRGSSLVVTGQQDRTIRPEVKPRARTNGSGGRAEPVRAAVRDHYVGRKKYLSRISTGRRRSDGGDPGVAADHRSASVLAFLKDGGGRPRIVGGDRPEHDVLLRTQGRSTDGGLAVSRRRKPPLVLPRTLSGERRKGWCFAQPPEPGPLPHKERQRGSPSQEAAGHPLEREGLAFRERRKGPDSANLREKVLSLAGGRRSSSGETVTKSCDAWNVSVREESVCEGFAARHWSLHAK